MLLTYLFSIPTDAAVGLERTSYTVSGPVVTVQICALVYSPLMSCPIEFPFTLGLSAANGNSYTNVLASYSNFVPLQPRSCYHLTSVRQEAVFMSTLIPMKKTNA